jgi:hypothetical protein
MPCDLYQQTKFEKKIHVTCLYEGNTKVEQQCGCEKPALPIGDQKLLVAIEVAGNFGNLT